MTCIHSLEEYRLISNEEYFARFGEIEAALEEIRIEWDKETPGQKQEEIKKLEEKVKGYPDWMKIHLLSFCMKAGNDKETARRLLDVVLNADYAQVASTISCHTTGRFQRQFLRINSLRVLRRSFVWHGCTRNYFSHLLRYLGQRAESIFQRQNEIKILYLYFLPRYLGCFMRRQKHFWTGAMFYRNI